MNDYKADHRAAVMALSVMLHEAQRVFDAERRRHIDIGEEVTRVRAVLERQRDRIADLERRLTGVILERNAAEAELAMRNGNR